MNQISALNNPQGFDEPLKKNKPIVWIGIVIFWPRPGQNCYSKVIHRKEVDTFQWPVIEEIAWAD